MQTEVPSVLVVLVARNGAAWLPRTLASLARQSYPRLGVVAVDNGSSDGSADLLSRALGPRRVVRLDEDRGFAGAVRRALEIPAVREADYVLLLHDDLALARDAVARMVDEAARVQGAGVVAPKVLDWAEPRVLREVGFSSDRFGYPQSPLEDGEIDQGQYDAPRDVLFVSSAAMLVSGDVWRHVAPPDDRLGPAGGDLDFCWRVRLAGYRVLVTPRAMAVHRGAADRDGRPDRSAPPDRYQTERAALAGVLVNYRLATLLWVLPLYAVQGIARLIFYVLTRRFSGAGDVVRAWWWNITHLPGTLRRRAQAQHARRVPDRDIANLMTPAATRLQRWITNASSVVVGDRAAQVEEGEELEAAPLPQRVAGVISSHPVAVGVLAAVVFTLMAFRGVLFAPSIEGGALPVFPSGASAFFGALASGWLVTGFGGPGLASPALVPLGVGSFLALGDPDLLARLLIALGPVLAAASCYRAVRALGPRPGASVVAGASYGLAAPTLWAASEGRIAVVVLFIALPWVSSRLVGAFAPGGPDRPLGWAVGTGMGLALLVSFEPRGWIAAAAVAVPLLVLPQRGGSRLRGVALTLAAALAGAVLVSPFLLHLVEAAAWPATASVRARFADLLALVPGPGPGSGISAAFVPLAGLLGFALAAGDGRRAAWRALATAAGTVPMAWLAAADRLPAPLGDPAAYLAAAAFSFSVLIGLGIAGLPHGVRSVAFGTPQVVAAGLAVLVGVGLAGQAVRSLPGGWAVGERRLPPAWPVVVEDGTSAFRVLWLAPDDDLPLPPPGGDPEGTVVAGGTRLAYGVTGRLGRSVLATGVPPGLEPLERVEAALEAVFDGRVRHGGALLAPMAIRYVVAAEGRLPETAGARLGEQMDLDLVQRAGGLWIYRNARALPPAGILPGEGAAGAARSSSLLAPLGIDPATTVPVDQADGVIRGSAPEEGVSLLFLADRFDPGWNVTSATGAASPFPAFGWGLGFEVGPGEVRATFDDRSRRVGELVALGVAWALALWVVRRSPREERRPASSPSRSVATDVAPEPNLSPT